MITISGHSDDFYNGDYAKDEDWYGYPHYSNPDGAHLYFFYTGYWQLDDQIQDGTSDYHAGGYMFSSDPDPSSALTGDLAWSTGDALQAAYQEWEAEPEPEDEVIVYTCFELTGNDVDRYNTRYCESSEELLSGYPLYRSVENDAYVYHFPGYWQLDYRVQDPLHVHDWYDGGCVTVDSADDFGEWVRSGEVRTVSNDCQGSTMTMTPVEVVEVVRVSGHGDDAYNGQYRRANDWGGSPHFVMGDKHLYYGSGG